MRSIVDASAFFDALGKLSEVVQECSVPALSGVQIRFEGAKCVLTATDIGTWLITEIPAYGEDFSFVLPRPGSIAKAFRNFKGDLSLEFTETEKRQYVMMTCGARSGEFEVIPAEDYPSAPQISESADFTINANTLRKRVNTVKYAAQKDNSSRESAMCVQFDGSRIFAVDGYRMAWDIDETISFIPPFMAQAKAFEHLKIFADKELAVQSSWNMIRITDGTTCLYVKPTVGVVLNVANVIPEVYRDTFTVDPKAFLRELQYLGKTVSSKRSNAVRLCNGELTVTDPTGTYRSCLTIRGTNELPIGFDIRYMEDAMKQFKDEPLVTVKISGKFSPIVVEAENRSDHALLLPVRLREEQAAA